MTGKKNPTKDAALLEALRSNLHLLGEIAMRYEVEAQLGGRAGQAARPGPRRAVHGLLPSPRQSGSVRLHSTACILP